MARTAESVRAQIEALRQAMSSGAASVSYEGRTVTYRSYGDMRQALQDLLRELAQIEGRAPTNRMRLAEYDRGRR